MFRTYKHLDDIIDDKKNSSSWLDTLSNASGWINPFYVGRNRVRDFLVAALSISQITQAESSQVCFISDSNYDGFYKLDCTTLDASYYFNQIKSCNDYIVYSFCDPFMKDNYNFGRGTFGGTLCTLSAPVGSTHNQCAIDILNEQIKDRFGSTQDLLAVTGIVAAATVTAATAICCFFHRRNKNHGAAAPDMMINNTPGETSSLINKV